MRDITRVPHASRGQAFVTDGGLETTLIFHEGIDLPQFAAFVLLEDEAGRRLLLDYYRRYMAVARSHGAGFIAETPTWRANPDWGETLGYPPERLDRINRDAVDLLDGLRHEDDAPSPFLISGCVGPRGDGYRADARMTREEAAAYHSRQIRTFAGTAADMVAALTITYPEEAIGIVDAAVDAEIPVAVSFTVETDGRLPSGQELGEAIEQVDAATDGAAAYFMINCAHPSHFHLALEGAPGWVARIGGLRANASERSHEELDEAEELDEGDPADLGRRHGDLRRLLPGLRVLGGCCGTDHRHVSEIVAAWRAH